MKKVGGNGRVPKRKHAHGVCLHKVHMVRVGIEPDTPRTTIEERCSTIEPLRPMVPNLSYLSTYVQVFSPVNVIVQLVTSLGDISANNYKLCL